MTRAPGRAGDDPEPEGGRAAERLRQMMLERFGTTERPEPPDVGHGDHAAGADPAAADAAPSLQSRVQRPAAASPVERPAAAEGPEHS